MFVRHYRCALWFPLVAICNVVVLHLLSFLRLFLGRYLPCEGPAPRLSSPRDVAASVSGAPGAVARPRLVRPRALLGGRNTEYMSAPALCVSQSRCVSFRSPSFAPVPRSHTQYTPTGNRCQGPTR